MGSLAGLNSTTKVDSVEIVSTDKQFVIQVQRTRDVATIRVRLATDEWYASKGPTFELDHTEANVVIAALSGADMGYQRDQLAKITNARFSPVVEVSSLTPTVQA